MKRIVDKGVDFALAAMLLVMTVIVFAQVFFRYVLNAPLSWPEETARMLIIWMTFVGAYMALREHRHIGFNLVVKKFPRTARFWIEVGVLISILAFLAVVIREGAYFAQRSFNIRMPYTRISVGWFVYSAFPVSGVLMFAQTIIDLVARVKMQIHGVDGTVEQAEVA